MNPPLNVPPSRKASEQVQSKGALTEMDIAATSNDILSKNIADVKNAAVSMRDRGPLLQHAGIEVPRG